MFGMGMGEIVLIAIVALLALGPEKLPEAAKSISKGIRGLRKQTQEIQQTIERDTEVGGAIKDLKSALRGDPVRKHIQSLDLEKETDLIKPNPAAVATNELPTQTDSENQTDETENEDPSALALKSTDNNSSTDDSDNEQ